jgi:hypothetical protein
MMMVPVRSFSFAYSFSTMISYIAWVAWPPILRPPSSSSTLVLPQLSSVRLLFRKVECKVVVPGVTQVSWPPTAILSFLGGPAILGHHSPRLPSTVPHHPLS